MSKQKVQLTEAVNRRWAVVQILPDTKHYPVAKFYNRQDAEDHLRFLRRFMPALEFTIVCDRSTRKQDSPRRYDQIQMNTQYKDFLIRSWKPTDREQAAAIIRNVLTEYGLSWQPKGADQDVMEVETFYQATGGEFWVIEQQGQLVGTAAYYPIKRGEKAVEIRKMYLSPIARGKGLGKYLLQQLEQKIASRGYQTIWIETATILKEAVKLYESSGYQPTTGVETQRCDLVYVKSIKDE